ncbi:MAG: phosphotransferase [Anaerolineae bacterium]|nr:phosphotransferase [Anaerolineae bacterium]
MITAITGYLTERHGAPVDIQSVRELNGQTIREDTLKQFGYGRPLLVTYYVGGVEKSEVFHRIRRNTFGRERDDDRVAVVWLDYHTFNRLPRHVTAVDMLLHTAAGDLQSIQTADELLLVTTYQPGVLYATDLARIRDEGVLQPIDWERAANLARYLAEIHQTGHDDPALWRRRLRDLVGHGEGIMGLTDSYPPDLVYADENCLQEIETQANRWRWRLKPLHHRLCQVHGDFHPFNIGFTENSGLFALDRSRGEWGEPADDVSCLTVNYLFFSLQRDGKWTRPFTDLHDHFWQQYLAVRPDEEMTAVIQPWFAWRALVLASPLWYPHLTEATRRQLLTFARRVLAIDRFDYRRVNELLA